MPAPRLPICSVSRCWEIGVAMVQGESRIGRTLGDAGQARSGPINGETLPLFSDLLARQVGPSQDGAGVTVGWVSPRAENAVDRSRPPVVGQ
jgi:hypothetical protein